MAVPQEKPGCKYSNIIVTSIVIPKKEQKNEPDQCTLCKPSQELETKQLPVVSVDWRFPGLNWPVPNSWLGLKLHVG